MKDEPLRIAFKELMETLAQRRAITRLEVKGILDQLEEDTKRQPQPQP